MSKDSYEKPANQSVSKLLQLIDTLSKSKLPMRLQDIVEETGIPQATCLRYINALIAEGYAYQDEDSSRYSMTWRICSLGEQVHAHRSIRTLSGNIAGQLSAKLGLGICLVIEHDMECMYLDCIYDPLTMGRTLLRIGKQTPLYAASSGKLLLSEYSREALDQMVQKKGFVPLTKNTISSMPELVAEMEKVRKNGYALDDEECEAGLRCVAAPIRNYTGRIVAALSAFGAKELLSDSRIQNQILPELREATQTLSMRMGYKKPN